MSANLPPKRHSRIAITGLLDAGGAVLVVATLCGFLGPIAWFLDLFSHFRVQYALSLAIIAVLTLAQRGRRRVAALFATAAILNMAVIAPLYLPVRNAPASTNRPLRAMLLNVNTALGDPARVRRVIEAENPDFIVLEEISDRWVRELAWLRAAFPFQCQEPREDNFGIGLYSKFPLANARIAFVGDADVPSILARAETTLGALAIVATHPLPPGGAVYTRLRNDQLRELPRHLPAGAPLLLLGDLNTTPWNHNFRRLVRRTGLLDSARGHGVQTTWPNFAWLLRIPLDHCLYSPDIAIIDRRVGPDVGSDHFPLIVDFTLSAAQ